MLGLMVPVSRLLCKYSVVSRGKFHMRSGVGPLNLLFCKNRLYKPVTLPMLGLIVPDSLLLCRYNCVNWVSLHISSGMLPWSEQLLKANILNLVSWPILSGMLPVSYARHDDPIKISNNLFH